MSASYRAILILPDHPTDSGLSALVVLAVERGSVWGHFLDVVVDRPHQLFAVAAAACLDAEDKVAAKTLKLCEICLHAFGFGFLIDLAHPLLVVGLRAARFSPFVIVRGYEGLEQVASRCGLRVWTVLSQWLGQRGNTREEERGVHQGAVQ